MNAKKYILLMAALFVIASCNIKEKMTVSETTEFAYNDADRVNIFASIEEKNGIKHLVAYSLVYKGIDEEITQIQNIHKSDDPVATFLDKTIAIKLTDNTLDLSKESYIEFELNEDGTINAYYMLNIIKDRVHVNGDCTMEKK